MYSVERKENRVPAKGAVMLSNDVGFVGGLMVNISNSGLCAYVQDLFDMDAEISVFSSSFSSKGPRVAKVVWCSHISDDLYKIGLAFSRSD